MGQALRRVTGRFGVTTPPASSLSKSVEHRPTYTPPVIQVPTNDENLSRVNAENLLEDRDPQYDAMLSQMVCRIQPKPRGKLKMGEASVVEKYKRSLPKLRNTTLDSTRYEDRPAPPGTLNVAQLRQAILLYQGKSDDHDGPMSIQQIAEKFHVDVSQVQKILQFIKLPPEDNNKSKTHNE